IAAIREGRLSSWAAAHMIAPLSRANAAHADRLLRAQERAQLSTRDLRQWFEHYQKARRGVRERMVDHPGLFVRALKEKAEERSSERLRDGPEGECEAELWRMNGLAFRVGGGVPLVEPVSAAVGGAVR